MSIKLRYILFFGLYLYLFSFGVFSQEKKPVFHCPSGYNCIEFDLNNKSVYGTVNLDEYTILYAKNIYGSNFSGTFSIKDNSSKNIIQSQKKYKIENCEKKAKVKLKELDAYVDSNFIQLKIDYFLKPNQSFDIEIIGRVDEELIKSYLAVAIARFYKENYNYLINFSPSDVDDVTQILKSEIWYSLPKHVKAGLDEGGFLKADVDDLDGNILTSLLNLEYNLNSFVDENKNFLNDFDKTILSKNSCNSYSNKPALYGLMKVKNDPDLLSEILTGKRNINNLEVKYIPLNLKRSNMSLIENYDKNIQDLKGLLEKCFNASITSFDDQLDYLNSAIDAQQSFDENIKTELSSEAENSIQKILTNSNLNSKMTLEAETQSIFSIDVGIAVIPQFNSLNTVYVTPYSGLNINLSRVNKETTFKDLWRNYNFPKFLTKVLNLHVGIANNSLLNKSLSGIYGNENSGLIAGGGIRLWRGFKLNTGLIFNNRKRFGDISALTGNWYLSSSINFRIDTSKGLELFKKTK